MASELFYCLISMLVVVAGVEITARVICAYWD